VVRLKVVCVVLLLVGSAIAQRWVTPAETTNFRYTRFDGEYFPGTGKVYFMGGRLYDATTTGAIWSFDPSTRTYANTGAAMPAPISNYDICLLRDNYSATDTFGLYVVGSRNGAGVNIDTVQVYYPKSNTTRIVTTDSFPGRIGGATYAALGSVVAGNKLYVMGGFLPTSWLSTNQCFVYDPLAAAGSRWSTLPSLSVARCYIAGAVIEDTLLYAIGGDTANMISAYLYATAKVERLNLRNLGAGWTSVASLPAICGESRAFAFNTTTGLGISRQIVVGSIGQWPAESANCYIYHVTGDSWSTFPKLDSARRNHAGAFIPGTAGANGVPGIWVWGGRKGSDANCLATPEYYQLGIDVGTKYIASPSGSVDSGASVTPACSVSNYGIVTRTSVPVRMKVGSAYNQTATIASIAPGVTVYVTLPTWTVSYPPGNYAVSCSTELTSDINPGNDKQTGTVTVYNHDVGVRVLLAPTGTMDSVATIVPACSVYNYGNATEASYPVRMRVGASYNQTATVTSHAPGTTQYVTFPPWTVGPRGSYAVTCSTELGTDRARSNDRMTGLATIRIQDVYPPGILAPAGTVPPNQVVTPQARVRNLGNSPATFDVQLAIASGGSPVYQDTETVTGLAGGGEATVTFSKTWTATPVGNYTTIAWTMLSGDVNPANDTVRGSFTVSAGGGSYPWQARAPVPTSPSGKYVKDGGWLTYDSTTKLVFASKGNKTADFYAWDAAKDSWRLLAPWPLGTDAKLPSKGSVGCADGRGIVFATKGNNKSGFWKYDAATNTWTQKRDVPLGLSNKKVKGGTDITWAYKGSVGSPYLLKGYKNEFYRYDVAADSWQTLAPAPVGANLKYDKGSWLAYDLQHTIFAHKAKYHEFYSYNTLTDSWNPTPLQGMPLLGIGGSKKSKDGGCGTYHDSAIYALKGGNTQQFWKYNVAANIWFEKETLPKGLPKPKKVKAGADITTRRLIGDRPGEAAELPALTGNKTGNFWVYITPGGGGPPMGNAPNRDGVAAEKRLLDEPFLTLAPNPLSGGFMTLRYSLPGSGLAMVRVYDVTGRTVLPAALITDRNGTAQLDLRSLNTGVYLLKVEGSGFATVRKLVVER
jgi:hypothetical protein